MKTSRIELIRVAATYGLSLPDDTSSSTALIAVEAAMERLVAGLASPEMVERLLDVSYNPELVLSLSWAHANEMIRLLTADSVRTTEGE